jgi:mono/diheme cytochrome c family protein
MLSSLKVFTLASLALGATTLGACTRQAPAPSAAWTQAQQVERGRQLVSIGACNDCHTPMKFDPEIGMPVPDMSRMLSGHPEGAPEPASTLTGHDNAVIGPTFTSFKAPFGTVFTANLTPDAATGLGAWTEDMFIRALRTGRHMGGTGRPIIPPMPWPMLAAQTDADLKAIFAYLRSIPAIRNEVPAPKVPDEALNAIAASYDKMLAKMAAAPKTAATQAAPAATVMARR